MKRKPKFADRVVAAGIGVAAILLLVIGVQACSAYTEHRTVTATVLDKDRVCETVDSGSKCKYLIFTDQGTFRVEDSLLIGRVDSSDVYGRFRVDRTYEFEVYGWRIPIASSYPNVASAPQEVRQ